MGSSGMGSITESQAEEPVDVRKWLIGVAYIAERMIAFSDVWFHDLSIVAVQQAGTGLFKVEQEDL